MDEATRRAWRAGLKPLLCKYLNWSSPVGHKAEEGELRYDIEPSEEGPNLGLLLLKPHDASTNEISEGFWIEVSNPRQLYEVLKDYYERD